METGVGLILRGGTIGITPLLRKGGGGYVLLNYLAPTSGLRIRRPEERLASRAGRERACFFGVGGRLSVMKS